MPLRKAAEDTRNLHANEIARAVHAGKKPSPQQVKSWAKYDRGAETRDRSCSPVPTTPRRRARRRPDAYRSRPAIVTAARQTQTRDCEPSRRVTSTCTARSVYARTTARSWTRISTKRSHTSTVSPSTTSTTGADPISSGVNDTGAGRVRNSLVAARLTSAGTVRYSPVRSSLGPVRGVELSLQPHAGSSREWVGALECWVRVGSGQRARAGCCRGAVRGGRRGTPSGGGRYSYGRDLRRSRSDCSPSGDDVRGLPHGPGRGGRLRRARQQPGSRRAR